MFDVTILGAVFAGLLSFLSPCILPIVPFYISYLAGVGMNQISADAHISPAVQRRAVFAATLFALGVITVFMGLGAAAMQAAERWLIKRGVWKLNLLVRAENETVRSFYEKLGYEVEPRLCMARKLLPETSE